MTSRPDSPTALASSIYLDMGVFWGLWLLLFVSSHPMPVKITLAGFDFHACHLNMRKWKGWNFFFAWHGNVCLWNYKMITGPPNYYKKEPGGGGDVVLDHLPNLPDDIRKDFPTWPAWHPIISNIKFSSSPSLAGSCCTCIGKAMIKSSRRAGPPGVLLTLLWVNRSIMMHRDQGRHRQWTCHLGRRP